MFPHSVRYPPGALSAELFNAVVDIAGTDRFLPYDKDRRWSNKKDERVIVGEIVHEPGLTVIPTSTRGRDLVKIHYCGDSPPRRSELTRWTRKRCAIFGAATGRVIWFQNTPKGARTRLLLKMFGDQDKRGCGEAMQLTECAVADTFPAFAEQLGADGFAFLHRRIKTGFSDGPILVRVEDRRIVGAVGPMGTLLDATGTRMQPPQYFAVHPHYRRRGHGRALWRAAMAWGAENGAKYKVLQAASGSASELLYLSEGLSTLGFVCCRDS
ncbi:MAG TPA: GNAT family N-acetyltransferase [Pseudonocardiaceae bacterium]|jgi:GNAT superfamily N-acetyltransferase|nr:GNAT family N-acetyltransferase [Pseudonocardiaceae bacterium]